MNQDIDNIYGSSKKSKEKSSPATINKKAQIKAEKRLKEEITSKPFNLGNIKNINNIKNDLNASPKTKRAAVKFPA